MPVLVAVVLVIAAGAAEGVWTDRWHVSDALVQAAGRVAAVPPSVGDWEGHGFDLDPRVAQRAEATGYIARRYTNRRTGTELTVLLICGRPGPVAAHSPDVCYGGAGYRLATPPERKSFAIPGIAGPDGGAHFKVARFDKDSAADPDRLRILWSYTATGEWAAPDQPRFTFARYPVLYKLYVIRSLAGGESDSDADPAADFLRQLLPQLQKALFPAAAS